MNLLQNGEAEYEDNKVSSEGGGNFSDSGWGNVDDLIQRTNCWTLLDQKYSSQ